MTAPVYVPLPLHALALEEAVAARCRDFAGDPAERAFAALLDALAAAGRLRLAGYPRHASAALCEHAERAAAVARALLEARDRARSYSTDGG